MKKLGVIGLMALSINLASCEKETNTAPTTVNTTARVATSGKLKAVTADQLPVSIKDYIQDQYASAIIKHAGQGPRGNYGVLVEQNGVEKALFFKGDGTFKAEHDLKMKRLDVSVLPTLATRYLQKNYSGATIKRVSQGPRGNYGVLVQAGDAYQLLAFTKNGVFLREINGASGGKLVEKSELPILISTYLESHYTGAIIKGAGQGPKGKYGVVIEVEGKRKLVLFDQDGSFLRELSR